MEDLARALADDRPSLQVPWGDLARLVRPVPGTLMILLGAPGAMKSMLSLAWCLELDAPTRIISLDTDPLTQAARVVARTAKLSTREVLDDPKRWADWLLGQRMKVRLLHEPVTAEEVGQVVEADREFWGIVPSLVVVDDVSKLRMKDRGYSDFDSAMLELHRAAKRLNTVVLALHHVHRGESSARVKPIRLADGKYCPVPEAMVLCDDLQWRQAGDLRVGQGIISFDRDLTYGKYRLARVVANGEARKPCVTVETSLGETVVSHDHPFAVLPYKKKRIRRWVNAEDLRQGDKIMFFASPWKRRTDHESGYIAGMFDGEGNVDGHRVAFAQNPGPVLDHVEGWLRREGFRVGSKRYPNGGRCVQIAVHGRDRYRLLGEIGCIRLTPRAVENIDGAAHWYRRDSGWAEVVGTSRPEVREIALLTTTTGTFIGDGFISRNTGEYEAEIVLGAWRPTEHEMKVGVLKNRFGPDNPNGGLSARLHVDPATVEIRDYDWNRDAFEGPSQ